MVRIGSQEYRKIGSTSEHIPGFIIVDQWDVFSSDANHYVLSTKITDRVTFLELYCDGDAMIIGREWQRRPRDDGTYSLVGRGKYHGMKQPTAFTQKLRIISR